MNVSRLTLLAALLLPAVITDRVEARPQHGSHGAMLPVAVDGAKTPEAIPDSLAYRHFIKAMALRDKPSADDLAGRDAFLAEIGLSKADHDVFVAALTGVATSLEKLTEMRSQWTTDSPEARAAATDLTRQEVQLLEGTRGQLQARLSSEGWSRFAKHIQEHVKRRIVIYGGDPR